MAMSTAKTVRKRRRKLAKKKICRLCENRIRRVDYRDVDLLRRYQTEKGKILPRRITGNCFRHQKLIGSAIKRARNLSLVL